MPGDGLDPAKMPGHWLLARAGKRVLRPGGVAMTAWMLDALDITPSDDVVELAPGLGATAARALARNPATYTGVERDEAAAGHLRRLLRHPGDRCQVGTALETGLGDASASVVFGEAFLTMQSDEHKERILAEAYRLLRPGGRFALHELRLRPDHLPPEQQRRVRGELARSIHVGARPITAAAWQHILEKVGFTVVHRHEVPMGLLHPGRLVADEGWRRAARIVVNIAGDGVTRRRVLDMRRTFRRNADLIGAIGLVAVKR